MNGHHLILGEIEDFITGKKIKDTHDERYRQKIARLLVEKKGFSRESIKTNHKLHVKVQKKGAILKLDFLITLSDKIIMLIKYGPGSIITRHRPTLSASRITEAYQIPLVVVTNGETADILNGATGKIINRGIENIPSQNELNELMPTFSFEKISNKKREMESRILYTFEVDGRCPCDDDICIIS